MMRISIIILKDEPTEEEPKPKEHKENGMMVTSLMKEVGEADLKMLELELNIFQLSDACDMIEGMKATMEKRVKACITEKRHSEATSLLVGIQYAQEIWSNIARSISTAEEEIASFEELSTTSL